MAGDGDGDGDGDAKKDVASRESCAISFYTKFSGENNFI